MDIYRESSGAVHSITIKDSDRNARLNVDLECSIPEVYIRVGEGRPNAYTLEDVLKAGVALLDATQDMESEEECPEWARNFLPWETNK